MVSLSLALSLWENCYMFVIVYFEFFYTIFFLIQLS